MPSLKKLLGHGTQLIGVHSRLNGPAEALLFKFLGRCQLNAIRHKRPQETEPVIADQWAVDRLECNSQGESVS